MKVWILQTGEPLHCDGGAPRPMRAMNLANALAASGHTVRLWSSGFYHQEKRHRARGFESIKVAENLEIELIPSRGYERNVGFDRLLDHAQLAWNLRQRLRAINSDDYPDVIFVGYPPIEAADTMLQWAKRLGIPSMVDVKDQWPALFVEAFPSALQPAARVGFAPYFWLGRRALSSATAFCSMSEPFLDWMCRFSGRSRRNTDIVAPLSSPRPVINDESRGAARAWWQDRGVDLSHSRRFVFIGSLSRMFDFSSVVEVARRFVAEQQDCQLVICGTGDEFEPIRASMEGLANVIFPGWIDRPKIETLVGSCSGMLAPYRNTENFTRNLPNKIVDSFAMGRPVLSGLDGEVRRWLEDHQVGFFTPDGAILYEVMTRLLNEPGLCTEMSRRSRSLYDACFEFEKVYGDLVESLCQLAGSPSSATSQ